MRCQVLPAAGAGKDPFHIAFENQTLRCLRPLRNAGYILGLPHLQHHLSKPGCSKLTALQSFVISLLQYALAHEIFLSLENPRKQLDVGCSRSFMCKKRAILRCCVFTMLSHQSSSALVGTEGAGNALVSLAGGCPGNHTHAPYQVWSGSPESVSEAVAESEYPFELCRTIAARTCQANFCLNRLMTSLLAQSRPKSHKPCCPNFTE